MIRDRHFMVNISIPTDVGSCSECQRPLATEHDEAWHNTGACGCEESRSLCWYKWNGNKCLPRSFYDNRTK